jgi:hypothetical protein
MKKELLPTLVILVLLGVLVLIGSIDPEVHAAFWVPFLVGCYFAKKWL